MVSKMRMFVDQNKNSYLRFYDENQTPFKYGFRQDNTDNSLNLVENSNGVEREVVKFLTNGDVRFDTYVAVSS